MRIPRPETPFEIALAVGGGLVGLLVVLPLLPVVTNLVFGAFEGVLDVIVPGGNESA